MAKQQPPPPQQFEQIVQAIAQLDSPHKQELLAILRAMLEAENDQPEEEQTPKESREYQGAKGGRGYYERSGVGRSLLTDRPS